MSTKNCFGNFSDLFIGKCSCSSCLKMGSKTMMIKITNFSVIKSNISHMFNLLYKLIITKSWIIVNSLLIVSNIMASELDRDHQIGQLFIVPVCPNLGEDNFQKVRKLI